MTKISWQLVSTLTLTAACGSPAVDLGNAGAALDRGGAAQLDASTPSGAEHEPVFKSSQPPALVQSSCTDHSALLALAQQQCQALRLPRIPSAFFGERCGLYRSTSLDFLCAQQLPDNTRCQTTYVGSAEACVEDAALLAQARMLSNDADVAFADILYDHACGDNKSHWAQFEYCGSTDRALPDPSDCTSSGLDTDACVDPSSLLTMAAEACNGQDQALVDYAFAPACGADNATVRGLKYECCPNSF